MYEVPIVIYFFVIYQVPRKIPISLSGGHVNLFLLNESVEHGSINLFKWTCVNTVQKYLQSCGDY